MEITKKDNKELFNALVFCARARTTEEQPLYNLALIQVKHGKAIATDGHRLHVANTKDLTGGLYEYSKQKQTITLKPAKGRFPDVAIFIRLNKNHAHITSANTKELLHMCKMAKIMVRNEWQGSKFTFNGCCNIEVVCPDEGSMTGDVPIKTSIQPEVKIGLNIKHVIDALKDLDGTVTIGLPENGPMDYAEQPISLKDKTKYALVMPMRL